MTFPSVVKIGPYHYTVYRDAARMSDVRNDCGEGNRVGQIHYQKLTIDLDPTLAHDRQVSALLHEVLHGCMHYAFRSDDVLGDEKIVGGLEGVLLDVLRDNPELVACLTETE